MKTRYRMFRRRGGVFYLHDSVTGKQESLRTTTRAEAESLLGARNTALPGNRQGLSDRGRTPRWRSR